MCFHRALFPLKWHWAHHGLHSTIRVVPWGIRQNQPPSAMALPQVKHLQGAAVGSAAAGGRPASPGLVVGRESFIVKNIIQ
jgi:hypothetical protein